MVEDLADPRPFVTSHVTLGEWTALLMAVLSSPGNGGVIAIDV
jgi:hypothetical protein